MKEDINASKNNLGIIKTRLDLIDAQIQAMENENKNPLARQEAMMLEKLKTIAHKWTESSLFWIKCGCGFKRPKLVLWVSLGVLGLILFLAQKNGRANQEAKENYAKAW